MICKKQVVRDILGRKRVAIRIGKFFFQKSKNKTSTSGTKKVLGA